MLHILSLLKPGFGFLVYSRICLKILQKIETYKFEIYWISLLIKLHEIILMLEDERTTTFKLARSLRLFAHY